MKAAGLRKRLELRLRRAGVKCSVSDVYGPCPPVQYGISCEHNKLGEAVDKIAEIIISKANGQPVTFYGLRLPFGMPAEQSKGRSAILRHLVAYHIGDGRDLHRLDVLVGHGC